MPKDRNGACFPIFHNPEGSKNAVSRILVLILGRRCGRKGIWFSHREEETLGEAKSVNFQIDDESTQEWT